MRPVIAIVLAGGYGRRFAEAAPGRHKLISPLPDGRIVVDAALAAYERSVDEIVVVARSDDEALISYLRRKPIRVVVTPFAQRGMGHTLAVGVAEARYRFPTMIALLVGLADMPWLTAHTVDCVAASLRSAGPETIVRPTFQGTPGHPVGFGSSYFEELGLLTSDTGARALVSKHHDRVRLLPTQDYGCIADVDLPSDIS